MSGVTEREIVGPETYNHLRDYIFSTDFLEPLKATEQATKRGHCFAMREHISTTLPRYKADAKKKGITPVSERVYRRVLSSKVSAWCVCDYYLHTQVLTVHAGVYQLQEGSHHVQNMSPFGMAWDLGQGQEAAQSDGGQGVLGHQYSQ